MQRRTKMKFISLWIGILLLALFLRLYGINWDDGNHLHPDERFLTMVANNLEFPKSIGEYFDTAHSPLNPHNKGYNFYVYGTWPVILTKAAARILVRDTYEGFPLIGRTLAALADLLTVVFVFLITKYLSVSKNSKDSSLSPFLAMFFYATAVLPIQLSHFFTVDPFATLFLTISLYLIIQRKIGVALGILVGLAISAKISSALVVPIIAVSFFTNLSWQPIQNVLNKKNIRSLFHALAFLTVMIVTIRIAYPYVFDGFHINQQSIANYKELKEFDNPTSTFPPAIQWRYTKSYLFPLQSMLLYGIGLPLSILVFASLFYIGASLFRETVSNSANFFEKKRVSFPSNYLGLILVYIFILTIFSYQGRLYTKNMRYFLPMYPALMVLVSLWITKITNSIKNTTTRFLFLGSILCSVLVWPISFMAIYQRPHARVSATQWIYANIPIGKNIGYEHWDDPLPLHIAATLNPNSYTYTELPLYDKESIHKWQTISDKLNKTDYIVMSSNRLWRSIPRVPDLYPIAGKYYKALFDGSLGFHIYGHITSSPCFPTALFCLIPIHDQNAEESFTVYDHPEVYIFKKDSLNMTLLNTWIAQEAIHNDISN